MNKSILIASFVISIILFVSVSSLSIYQIITTYEAHAALEGYCHWRGLQVVNQSETFGYCKDSSGETYKIVLFDGRWYLNGDLPGSGLL
ncbi:MAG: hypothetical protein KGH55_02470 [Nanoarchaeota archaeon]|nr:hypothetical protein [Nanoarchaeota archaeon]